MANPYPAVFRDDNSETRLSGQIDFTDPANQPGGGSPSVTVLGPYRINFDTAGVTDPGGALCVALPTGTLLVDAWATLRTVFATPSLDPCSLRLYVGDREDLYANDPDLRQPGAIPGAYDASTDQVGAGGLWLASANSIAVNGRLLPTYMTADSALRAFVSTDGGDPPSQGAVDVYALAVLT